VQIVLHHRVEVDRGRDLIDAVHAVAHAVYIVERETHFHAGLVAAGLLAGAARKESDEVGAPLREDILNGAAEPGAIGQEKHHRGNAPRHPDHGDGGAAAVINHRLPRLAEDVFEHGRSASLFSSQLTADSLRTDG